MRTTSVSHEISIQFTYAERTADLAPWRLARHKIGKSYVKAYFRVFPIAAPEEDQDDRDALYRL
jgi:protein-ribulosamine 3-kinase